jgi:RNA recognition motif-containing protein
MMRPMRLFVGNLPWAFSSDDLARLFSEYGKVEDASVIKDRVSGRSRGFGFVVMASSRHGAAAVDGLNGSTVGGRQLTVNQARVRVTGSG